MIATGPHPPTPSPDSCLAGEGESRSTVRATSSLRQKTLAFVAAIVTVILLVGCGAGDDDITIIPPPGSPSPSGGVGPVTADPTPEPTEFRVAYINLMSPLSLDATNTTANDTFEARLQIIVAELKEFKPDLVAFAEVTETSAERSARAILAQELKMEPHYVRAKPWYLGRSKEANDVIREQAGFEEGELVLVSSRFPSLGAEKVWLNPRTSEAEGPAGLLVKVKGPASIGTIDVFVSHLTGADAKVRAQQAADFAKFVSSKRGGGPAVVLGDLGDPAGSPTQQAFLDIGLTDVLAKSDLQTCCRDGLIGELQPATTRTDYILTSNWLPSALANFGHLPKKLDDGTLLFASDHNGLTAVFPVGPVPPP
jgi:endonuclease/exonuclease/phosphatase family metal-dependent hydrolase